MVFRMTQLKNVFERLEAVEFVLNRPNQLIIGHSVERDVLT